LPDGSVLWARRVMLHCARVVFPAPDGSGALALYSEPAADLRDLFRALGGDDQQLSAAGVAAVAANG
jgi:hypothetical protein